MVVEGVNATLASRTLMLDLDVSAVASWAGVSESLASFGTRREPYSEIALMGKVSRSGFVKSKRAGLVVRDIEKGKLDRGRRSYLSFVSG